VLKWTQGFRDLLADKELTRRPGLKKQREKPLIFPDLPGFRHGRGWQNKLRQMVERPDWTNGTASGMFNLQFVKTKMQYVRHQ
jgi:hypothetical protein